MLRDKAKDIIVDIKNNKEFFNINSKLFKCIRGDQLSVVKEAFNKTQSPLARQDKKDLAVSINFIQKIVNKLSQIYSFEVERKSATDQDLVDFYSKNLKLNTTMTNANELFNGMKSCLVEIYLKKDKSLGVRPIPSDKFFVWSDDIVEPNVPEVYVKFVGKINKKKGKGECDLYFLYTDTEFLAVDEDGEVREEYKTENDQNDLGIAPFVYINRDAYELLPTPNADLLQNVVQICSIMTDANVANYYQSFPIRVLINADIDEKTNIDINPNSVIILNSKMGIDGGTPDFKEVASTLDTSKSINLAKEIIQNLFYCFDLSMDGAATESTSGLALTIKSSDMLENRKKQIEFFIPAEEELWNKLAVIHNNLTKKNVLNNKIPKKTFSDNFTVEVEFELPSAEVEQQKEMKSDDSEMTNKEVKESETDTITENDKKQV